MITFADSNMVPQLKTIWHEAFGDDRRYIDFFYQNRFTSDNTLVWMHNGTPAAMMTLLPATLQTDDGLRPVRYVYGVATKQEYRGRGMSSALIRHANNLADEKDEALILVPSSDGLFDFYQRNGYRTVFFLKHLMQASELNAVSQSPEYATFNLDARQYKALRDHRFAGAGYLIWDDAAIDYCLREHILTGGRCTKIVYDNQAYAALYHTIDKTLFVKETTLRDHCLVPILSDLARRHGCKQIHVRLPESSGIALPGKPFGMLYAKKPYQALQPYLNLVLD